MIFVILGTQDKSFVRLLQEMDRLIENGTITKQVIVQAGSTKYQSKNMEIHKMLPMKKFLNYMEQSDYVITHGGVGSILDALKYQKKVIAVPRLKQYGEHENNHQIQIIEKFTKENYILGCEGVETLKDAIVSLDKFTPNSCILGNEKMLQLINNYINETNPSKRKNWMIYCVLVCIAIVIQMLLYFVLHSFQNSLDAMWISFCLCYSFVILFMYPKRKHVFEFIWAIILELTQMIWFHFVEFDFFYKLLSIILSYIITYIGHTLFYRKELL